MSQEQAVYYPTLESLLSSRPPDRLLELTRSVRSLTSLVILFFILVVILFKVGSGMYDAGGEEMLMSPSFRLLTILPIVTLLEIIRRCHNDLYVIGRDRILHRRGRLSLRHSTPTVRMVDLRAISVEQGIWGRILDYGDVYLYPPGQHDPEIRLAGVRAPADLAKLVDILRQRSAEKISERTAGKSDAEFLKGE